MCDSVKGWRQIEQTYKSSIESQTERGAAASLLSLLPEEFTAADLIKLRARKGQSVKSSAISMVLNRWKANHRIEKATETTWRKLWSSLGATDFSPEKTAVATVVFCMSISRHCMPFFIFRLRLLVRHRMPFFDFVHCRRIVSGILLLFSRMPSEFFFTQSHIHTKV